MGYIKVIIEYILDIMSPDHLQTLLVHDKVWKMFIEESGLSSDEEKELYDFLKADIANKTTEDVKRLKEDNMAKKFSEVFPKVKAEIESHIQQLRALAERVDEVHKGCTISGVVTSSVGAASGVMSLLGLILAPFTAGGSLLLSAAGAGVGALSVASSVTTSVVEESTIYAAGAEADCILSTSKESLNRLTRFLGKTVAEFVEDGLNFIEKMKDMAKNIRALRQARANPGLARDAMRFTSTRGLSAGTLEPRRGAFTGTALSLTRAARMRGVATGGLFLALDVFFIVKDSIHLHEGAKAELAEVLRQKAKELEEYLEELSEILKHCS